MREPQGAVEQEVRELLADAGPRAAVPAEEVAAIKEAARAEWRSLVAGERRRRRALRLRGGLALAASVLLAVIAGWWWTTRPAPQAPPLVASVELLTGDVRVTPPGGAGLSADLAVGSRLPAGTTLETMGWGGGEPGRIALALGGGSLRLDAETRVTLNSARRLELERGALYYDSGAAPSAGGAVEVVTSLGTVRDVGTQFEVRLGAGDSAMRVRVREGAVALDAAEQSHRAEDGEQLSLHPDGSLMRAEMERYGPQWDWVVAAAPLPEVDGRSLEFFLDWFTRETGRRIRYADDSLAALAATTTVYGSFEGYTAEEALGAALRSSGLGWEAENGTILILQNS